jgi:hypothetical protein
MLPRLELTGENNKENEFIIFRHQKHVKKLSKKNVSKKVISKKAVSKTKKRRRKSSTFRFLNKII